MPSSGLTVVESATPLTWESLFAGPPQFTCPHDWFGRPLGGEIKWFLGVDSLHWYFGGASTCGAPSYDSGAERGRFFEGLWLHDLFEVFVLNEETGTYVEWNLGAQGAWWSACFDSYRVRAAIQPFGTEPIAVSTFVHAESAAWRAALSAPRATCPFLAPGAQIHFSAIVGSPSQRFVTSAPDVSGDPDFHLRDNFVPVSLVTVT